MNDKELFEEWKKQTDSTNMGEVLTAMYHICVIGPPEAFDLLNNSGSNLSDEEKNEKIIQESSGKINFNEFKERCISQFKNKYPFLTQRIEKKPAIGKPRIFISYNHLDRTHANVISLALSNNHYCDVFLDFWEMAVGDKILDRIDKEISDSDFVIALISPNSMKSAWVEKELQIVLEKQEKEERRLLIPILIQDCEVPEYLSRYKYIDFRDSQQKPLVIQSIINHVLDRESFSERIKISLNYQLKKVHTTTEPKMEAIG